MTSCCPPPRMRWSGTTDAIASCKRVSTGCGRTRRSVRALRWICGVKPKPKAVNKPLQYSIGHGLDKPGVFTTVSIFLQFGGRGIACALFAKGDEEAGGEDRPSTWEGLEEGKVGMGLGTLRDGDVEIGDGLQGDTELGNQRLDQQGIRGDNALIGGQRRGSLDGVAALCDHGFRAHVVVAEEGHQGGAARELGRF